MAASLLALTGCIDNNDQPSNTQQFRGDMPTCIIPLNSKDDSKVTLTNTPAYTYTYYTMENKWTLGAANIVIPGGPAVKFTTSMLTPGIDPTTNGYNAVFNTGKVFNSDEGSSISQFIGTFIQDYVYYTGESTLSAYKPLGHALMTMAFTVNDTYQVRAFPKTCYYAGPLVTKYSGKDGEQKTFTTTKPVFGVEVKLDTKTATITMHNVKFAEEMPISLDVITLANLPLNGDAENGYKVEAKNVTPMVGLGAAATPYPNYVFDEIEMHPTNTQMTTCEIEFKVAGKYEGDFLGSIAANTPIK